MVNTTSSKREIYDIRLDVVSGMDEVLQERMRDHEERLQRLEEEAGRSRNDR